MIQNWSWLPAGLLLGSLALASCAADSAESPEGSTDKDRGSSSAAADEELPDAAADAQSPVPAVGEPARGKSLGGFNLQVNAGQPATQLTDAREAFATLQGSLTSTPIPQTTDWVAVLESGDCEVLKPQRPFCEGGCSLDEACAVGDACQQVPSSVSVGGVSVTGLASIGMTDSFVMEPLNPTTNSYSAYGEAKLLYPPLKEGETLTVEAAGGELEPFTLETTGIAALELTVDGELPFRPDVPLELGWAAGNNPSARIHVVIDISHHGGTKGEIVCDTEDDGQVEIAGDLVAKLISLGVAGFPEVRVERFSRGYASIGSDHVRLDIVSRQVRLLSIDGLRSCTDDDQCSAGQACLPDSTCG